MMTRGRGIPAWLRGDFQVRACKRSLRRLGRCCVYGCENDAVTGVLVTRLVEHTRCDEHVADGVEILELRPMVWEYPWVPPNGTVEVAQ